MSVLQGSVNFVSVEKNTKTSTLPADPVAPAEVLRVLATCNSEGKMADRKNNNVPDSSANLLFSAGPEFNFNLPFMPVSQATGPAVLSGGEQRNV